MNKEFEQNEIEQILESIANHLSQTTDIYLFGGAVMVYNNLKPATKDIDILFEKEVDYSSFIKAAKLTEFVTKSVPSEYHQFDMSMMLQHHKSGWRLDLFLKKVCNKFCFNNDVKKRSRLFKKTGNLNIHFISFEDIFLMKSLTHRDRDLDDMGTIMGFGLNFEELTKEIENQNEHKWDIIERIISFEEHSGTTVAIPLKLKEDFEKYSEEKNKTLLLKQIKSMMKEGKSKEEIINHFHLTEEEWEDFK